MQLAEIRDLDGPNLFLLEPAIKLEIVLNADDSLDVLAGKLRPGSSDLLTAATEFIGDAYRKSGQATPNVMLRVMDDADHLVIAFGWNHRTYAMALATALFEILDDMRLATDLDLPAITESTDPDEYPSFIHDSDRKAIAIGVTGTNGKTTTTRLIAHIARTAGFRTGWNSSSGIYIEGEEIESGDYSGPSGARTILADPTVEFAVLETARGGILLRGLGYEHNDVSVFTNVSPDHLDLQGVRTMETLAETKAVVCRVTKPDGTVVVNAGDALVLAATESVKGKRVFFSRDADNDVIPGAAETGSRTIVVIDKAISVRDGDVVVANYPIAEIPIAFNGRAVHMIENAMCAIGAALGAGISSETIAAALKTFSNDSQHNPGRLNIYPIGQFTVIVDFAHNEAGLKYLLDFARGDLGSGGRLIAIIGTAGDRTNESLFEIGRMAGQQADIVIGKGTTHYLRGRELGDLMERYRTGARAGNVKTYLESDSELTAMEDALDLARPGDVIVIMAQEYIPEIIDLLVARQAAG